MTRNADSIIVHRLHSDLLGPATVSVPHQSRAQGPRELAGHRQGVGADGRKACGSQGRDPYVAVRLCGAINKGGRVSTLPFLFVADAGRGAKRLARREPSKKPSFGTVFFVATLAHFVFFPV